MKQQNRIPLNLPHSQVTGLAEKISGIQVCSV